jgi:hypothetical protein
MMWKRRIRISLFVMSLMFLFSFPILAKTPIDDQNSLVATGKEYQDVQNPTCQNCSTKKKPFKADAKILSEIDELKKEVRVINNAYHFDDSKYTLLTDKKGRQFVINKKYEKYFENVGNMDLSEYSTSNIDELKKALGDENPDKNLTPPRLPRGCGDGTGPVGDCKVQYYDKERVVTKKQYIRTEKRVDIIFIGDIPVPTYKDVDICYILYKEYRIPQLRCEFQGCVTYKQGAKEYVGEFSSPDMDCNDLPDVGQRF